MFSEITNNRYPLIALDLCSGAGGEALGLEMAGFQHEAAIEIDAAACQTLRFNRPTWRVIEQDIRAINGLDFRGIDLIAGGVPCPPFTIAGKQLGANDERDLFPEALRLIEQAKPRAVMLENVPGFILPRFNEYRIALIKKLLSLGYEVTWRVLNASSFGVPQLRPRFILVALRQPYFDAFQWPQTDKTITTVSQTIGDLMSVHGWQGLTQWLVKADAIAPTLVGGSKRHGGPDLGPTRARKQWETLGIDGRGIADVPPEADFPSYGFPRLTLHMVARIQAFPDDWTFMGGKTAIYRQIGNALPPPVAQAVGGALLSALTCKVSSISHKRTVFQPPLIEMM